MTLGQDPAVEELVLVRGADWAWGWDTAEGTAFEDGTELYIKTTLRNPTQHVHSFVTGH